VNKCLRTSHPTIQAPISPEKSQPHFDFAHEHHDRHKKVNETTFSICLITDTQYFIRGEHEPGKPMIELFERQTQWMVRHIEKWNIIHVIHVGDCVKKGYLPNEWELVMKCMNVLHGQVPYVVCIGNHDFNDCEDPTPVDPTFFLQNFGPQKFKDFDWYKGYSPNKLNSYQILPLTLCNHTEKSILCINAEYDFYSPDCIEWVENVLKIFNGKLPIVICSHWWVTPPKDKVQPSVTPRTRYLDLFLSFDSIFLVVCGHKRGAVHDITLNKYGNEVIELMRDELDASFPIISFDMSSGTIIMSTYNVLHQRHKVGVAHEWEHKLKDGWETRFGWTPISKGDTQ